MFKKETMFINVVKQNNNLKVEYKKYINNKEISEDNSTFLLDGDILPDNIVQKLNNLQNENDLSYISTLLLSDTTKLIPKSISPKVKDCEIINFNEAYDIVVLKTTLFETQNYFGKTGIDYIYSAFHIMNAHIQKQSSKNELLFFIYNDRAYILIVDLLTFDAVKRTHFYEDNLEGQKLFDELYYLELSELLQKILKNFHESQKEIFIQKVSFLFALRNLTKEQLTNLSLELMLKVDDYSVDIHDELFSLSRNPNVLKSFVVPRKKKKKKDSRYIFVFILFAMMFYGGYKIYNMIDFRKIAINLNLIEATKTINLEKLPDNILNNSNIEHRIKAMFNTTPQNVLINRLISKYKVLDQTITAKVKENLDLLKQSLNKIYQTVETKKLDEKQESNFEAIVVAKDELEIKDVVYGIFTKDYLQDELFDKESINEQLKILLPEHSIIKYIETLNANKVEIFSFSVNTIVKEPKDLFNIFTNINSELYSITISKPILMKNTNLGIEVDFIIEFNQLKN